MDNTAHTGPRWTKSSASAGPLNCVEAACVPHGVIIRDSKERALAPIAVPGAPWRAFLARLGR